MTKLTATLKHEFLEMLPPTIFFFVILHIIMFIRMLMIKGTGFEMTSTVSVLIASLILGKSVLLANLLPFINRFPERPLIWNATWKTIIYTVVATIIHYLEHLYDYWKEAPSIAAANHELLANQSWPRFWATEILLLVLIANYCVFAELSRVIGREKLRAMFIGPMPAKGDGATPGVA